MKLVSTRLSSPLELGDSFVASLVLESGADFRGFLEDLVDAISGGEGDLVLSEGDKDLSIAKKVDLIAEFVPFSLNRKSLLTALLKRLEKTALAAAHLEATQTVLKQVRDFALPLVLEIPHPVEMTGLTVGSLIKALGLAFEEADTSLPNRLLDYFRLVREFGNESLFVLVNLRSYLSDEEARAFLDVVLSEKYTLLLVDGVAKPLLPGERRVIVDRDLCEIVQFPEEELPPHSSLKK